MSFLISFVLSVINGSTGSNMIPQGILFSLSFFIALNLFDETETFGSIIDANLSLGVVIVILMSLFLILFSTSISLIIKLFFVVINIP